MSFKVSVTQCTTAPPALHRVHTLTTCTCTCNVWALAGDTSASQASPAPLFALGHSDDRATSNTWTTREMLGGDPAGLYGSAVAAFTYPVPDTANNPNLTNSSHEVVLEMGQASGIYVYGGFEMSLANSTTARATISSSFHVLKKAPGVSRRRRCPLTRLRAVPRHATRPL
jgi:hypothetical protein